LDEQGSYSSNEVAINWNAPLVLLLAETLPNGKKMVPLKNENK
jgi:hypothetical protein